MGVDELWDKLASAYDTGIQASGKEMHFLILAAFLLSFGFIRSSAHMIRAQVSWWPGNVETKGDVDRPALLDRCHPGLLDHRGNRGVRLDPTESTAILAPVQVAGALLAAACLYKGKRFAAIVGVFVPSSPLSAPCASAAPTAAGRAASTKARGWPRRRPASPPSERNLEW